MQRAFQIRSLLLVASLIISTDVLAYDQWEWTVGTPVNQTFKTKIQAEAAMRTQVSVGSVLTIETPVTLTDASAAYDYTAPDVNAIPTAWVYTAPGGTYSTEAAAIEAAVDAYSPSPAGCPDPYLDTQDAWHTTNTVLPNGTSIRDTSVLHIQTYSLQNGSCHANTPLNTQTIIRQRSFTCPSPYGASSGDVCKLGNKVRITGHPIMCSPTEGNPCNVTNGDKSLSETDYSSRTLSFVRSYHTQDQRKGVLGSGWNHNWEDKLLITSSTPKGVIQGGGYIDPLRSVSTGLYASTSANGSEVSLVSGNWVLRKGGGLKDIFDSQGQLIQREIEPGLVVTLTYTNGKLTSIADPFSHSLTLAYDTSGRIQTITDPNSHTYTYSYDTNNNLISVAYPNTTDREYVYEDTNFPTFITGIIDESGQRFSTYGYDLDGRVILSEHAGGAEHIELSYTSTSTTVTETIGASTAVRTYNFSLVNNRRRISSVTGDKCSSCGETAKSRTWTTSGYPDLVTDWNNVVTDYDYNTRGLETQRIEAKNTAQQRTITTTWHATFRLPTLITETGRTTAFTYDGNGNKLTETVTDTTVTPNVSRTTTWTYNSNGQVLTIDGPRTDVSDVTTYAYDSAGNVASVTDALSHQTQFTAYDANGNPLTVVDPNNVTTTMTYDTRQRLLTRTVASGTSAAATTTFEYWPTGTLKKIIQPDGSYLLYTYDDAQRLVQTEDNLGNYIVYTLDNAGNRTEEKIYDPSDVLVKTQSAVFNSLNRLIQTLGAASQSTQYAYDSNGNRTTTTDPNTKTTTNSYDALNRLIKIVDPENGSTHPTEYTYDARDNLTSAKDPRALTTQYQYNGFNEVTQLASPDTGTMTYTYDAAGNRASQTDAKSVTINYSYDALNRLTTANAPGTADDISYSYDSCTNGVGKLCSVTRNSVTLNYAYDVYGNIANVEQEIGSLNVDMDYVYDADLHLASVTYPSGVEVLYGYDTAGRVSSITLDDGTTTTLIDNITYQPFGPVKGYEQDNGVDTALDFDLDGRIENITAGTVLDRDYSYELAGNIEELDDAIINALDRTYTYDTINRLSLEEDITGTTTKFDYAYDAVGNRTLYDDTITSQTLTYGTTNNRLTAIGANSVTSDNNGNITSIHGMTLAYDAYNRLTSAIVSSITTNYTYNGLGERVTKQTGSNTTHYLYSGPNLLAEYDDTGDVKREYIYLQGQPVVMLDHAGSGIDIYWIHNDNLGRPLALTDSDGDVVWRLNNVDAFGNAASIDEDPDSDSVDLTLNLRFPGQYLDGETGFHYNYFRDYDPRTGRYIESDSIGLDGGLNTYLYANASPVRFIDPEGLQIAPTAPVTPVTPAPGGSVGPGHIDTTAPTLPKAFDLNYFTLMKIMKNAAQSASCKSCPSCTPYSKGTIGYVGPHTDHDHYPIGRPHLNLFVVNQNPETCKCFWNKNNPDVASPPPTAGWVDLNGVFPPLSP
jgi:RHS repeat-associated protein